MAHHAYFAVGERTAAIRRARAFAERNLGESLAALDIVYLSFEHFSVDDARRLISTASVSGIGGKKIIIASLSRIFHEAQNALLKILEEPPEGLAIILCVPSAGVFIPTLRSRLLPLPDDHEVSEEDPSSAAAAFLAASGAEREKIVGVLLERAKSDKEETKQAARRDAIELVRGLSATAHAKLHAGKDELARREARLQLEDLSAFMPILYERSAPLKLMFEHLLLVVPPGSGVQQQAKASQV